MAGDQRLRIAMASWEIGRLETGLGSKVGGLGVVVEELPRELVRVAARMGIELEVVTLTPCFGHHDRGRLRRLPGHYPATIEGHTFGFEAYDYHFEDLVVFDPPRGAQRILMRVVYFWDDWQLNWTNGRAIYPNDPWMGAKLYAAVSQAMAAFIRAEGFDTVHLHDYHVGLTPFYFAQDELDRLPFHFTIHNASYQGRVPVNGHGYEMLESLNLPGAWYFHNYFDFFDSLNFMKATMIKVHENGGWITTVSGDLEGSWGYAAELRESHESIVRRAWALKGAPPGEVFVPNGHLDTFEKLPIRGITNGLSDRNRADRVPELQAAYLRQLQERQGWDRPLFRNPWVRQEMLSHDHNFDADSLHVKGELRRLLHAEAFGTELGERTVLISAIGRLVAQKNFQLIAAIVERLLAHDRDVKLLVLASSPSGDPEGRALENRFHWLHQRYPQRVFYDRTFNLPLSKLMLAGSDFILIPSRFEPCGLVDYEAALCGTIPIVRATGGLTKIRHCGYLYEWLDISDPEGEAEAFFRKIAEALWVYRHDPMRHGWLIRQALNTDASWDRAARDYLTMYLEGIRWKQERLRGSG
jgi:glycogen synthase